MASFIFLIYLFWALVQDIKEKQVIRYTHLVGLAAVIGICCEKQDWLADNYVMLIKSIVTFLFLQILFCKLKMYGVADAIVFVMIILFSCIQHTTVNWQEIYLYIYSLSTGMLFMVQIIGGNVKGLNLRHSVPYIPYICVAFVLTNWVF